MKVMMHFEGEWEEVELSAALALVAEDKARELPADECSHYDDGMRSFTRYYEDEDETAEQARRNNLYNAFIGR